MIPLELVLFLLDTMRAEVIESISSPGNPTEFGFGTVHGRMTIIEELRERLNAAVEQSNLRNSEREDHFLNDRSSEEEVYQL